MSKRISFSSSDLIAIAKGIVPGHRLLNKFGENPAINTTLIDLWDHTADLTYLPAAEIMEIKSAQAADTSAGTGAQQIVIIGLDNNYVEITETIIMNGVTIVESTLSYIRIVRAYVTAAGSGGAAAGIISIEAKTANTIQAIISPEHNQTMMTHYTIPANHTGVFVNFTVGTGTGKEVHGHIKQRFFGSNVFRTAISLSSTETEHSRDYLGRFAAKTDLKITVQLVAGPAAVGWGAYTLLVIHNDYVGIADVFI